MRARIETHTLFHHLKEFLPKKFKLIVEETLVEYVYSHV